MDFLVSGVILIKAINTMGYPIAKLKDYLQLIITINNESIIIACNEERSGGIYAFNINDISPFARVLVCLKQSVLLDTSMISDDKLNLCNATQYLSQMPYFLHPDCKQINFVETMCNADKPIPFTFIILPNAINIGIIKAYKRDSITKSFLADSTALSNPKNEIYTIDLNQEIHLKAFVYERQKTYLASKDITDTNTQIAYSNSLQKGNITKNIISITPLESANIKWAFKIVDGSYKADSNARDKAFVALGEKQSLNITNKADEKTNPTNTTKDNVNKLDSIPDTKSYVVLENLQGDSITIKLSDIFSDTALESLVNKNIIFFAYNNSPAYCLYTDNEARGNNKIVSQDKITSIELKILKTRFRLEFDGEYLSFLENEREIAKWQARSGIAIDNKANGKEIKPIDRASIPSTDINKSFYYDSTEQSFLAESDEPYFITIPANNFIESLKAIQSSHINITDSTNQTIANINDESFKLAEHHNANTNINLAGAFSAFIQTLIKHINAVESLTIPLKVKYQKRILIIIERFKQSTESTTARMNIYVDRKRVDSSGKIADNAEFNSIYDIATPYAFILERPSPDSIGGELKLRIPEGRYDVNWRTNSDFGTTINPHNNFVGKNRAILFHHGNSPKNSNGCLLINKDKITKNNGEIVDNLLKNGKKDILIEHIQDDFAKAILGRTTNNIDNFAKTLIEIRIKNGF